MTASVALALGLAAAPLARAETDETAWAEAARPFDLAAPAAGLAPAVVAPAVAAKATPPPPVAAAKRVAEPPRGMWAAPTWLEKIVADIPGLENIHGYDDDGVLMRLARALAALPGTLALAIPHATVWGWHLVRDASDYAADYVGATLGAAVGFLVGLVIGLGVGALEFFRNLKLSLVGLLPALDRRAPARAVAAARDALLQAP